MATARGRPAVGVCVCVDYVWMCVDVRVVWLWCGNGLGGAREASENCVCVWMCVDVRVVWQRRRE